MAKSPHPSRLNRAAQELGYVCIYWAWLEETIDLLIKDLSHLDEEDVARSFAANTEIRQKIQITKALSFLRKPSDRWFKYVLELLDHTDHNLRDRRNKFTHAFWYIPKGRLIRQVRKTRLSRPQAFQYALSTRQEYPTKISEIQRLKTDLLVALKAGIFLLIAAPRDTDEPSPHKLDPRFLRLAEREIRRIRVRSKQQPQPRSLLG